jgi:chromosome segregation protein
LYVKQVIISNFKSFGGTTSVPLLPGFTVVSGPNGSGKSNILDALLFALGLSSSKGMRAERLPDLVNHAQAQRGKRSTVEASVTVTFDLRDEVAALGEMAIADRETSGDRPPSASADPSGSDSSGSDPSDPDPLDADADVSDPALVASEAAIAASADSESYDSESYWMWRDDLGNPLTELSVTRKLRVTQQGTYTSNYSINGSPCTLTELHQQLHRLRIYPEGYNVVLQGDVTGIISMNPKERRQIIDELAGVANFDRKITQTRKTLDEVKEREDRCRILEQELQIQCDRLAKDRAKALKYQQLRQEQQHQQDWERVLVWCGDRARAGELAAQLQRDAVQVQQLAGRIEQGRSRLATLTEELATLNQAVKALGESEQLTLQADLATQQAELTQAQRRQAELESAIALAQEGIATETAALQQLQAELATLEQADPDGGARLAALAEGVTTTREQLDAVQAEAEAIAAQSEAWVQQQTDLRHQIDTLQAQLDPQRAEQVRLSERRTQLTAQLEEQRLQIAAVTADVADKRSQLAQVAPAEGDRTAIQTHATALAAAEQEVRLQTETRSRLLDEQRQQQRQLDKLEAQAQAAREAQGTHAAQVILNSGLAGMCGLVAQLGRVEPRYQVALEIAAGGRLGFMVVEDDRAAAAGIELLKRERAGRLTFLPLNKMRGGRGGASHPALARGRTAPGWIDWAIALVEFDPRYEPIFEYVFGGTVVFADLDRARAYQGRERLVTLEGELIEPSGAMTGGSLQRQRGGLHFGAVGDSGETAEIAQVRSRLHDIERILGRCEQALVTAQDQVRRESALLLELRQTDRDRDRQREQLQTVVSASTTQLQRLTAQADRLATDLQTCTARLAELERTGPQLETQLEQLRQTLSDLETSGPNSQWQVAREQVRAAETEWQQAQAALRAAEQAIEQRSRQSDLTRERQTQAIARREQHEQELRDRQAAHAQTLATQVELRRQMATTQAQIAELEKVLGERKQERDRVEQQVQKQHLALQSLDFDRTHLLEQQIQHRRDLAALGQRLRATRAELPDPLPEIPGLPPLDAIVAAIAPPTPDPDRAPAHPTAPESADLDLAEAERTDPERTNPEPADLEPADLEPADLEPADAEPTDAESTGAEPTEVGLTGLRIEPDGPAAALPPLAELTAQLELVQKTVRSLQHRLEALEPVNMLALEEYDRVQERLQQLSDKLTTLEEERTELLLRVENFTTLRRQAFQEAFDAVDRNFQVIFAELSQGDGRLQLDDPEDPLNGGLNLVAHPKGKPVQRLSSMSGGEKSLTALSFIFALQRYRPSPFYAFDEVDMFLDGANVERLAKMIKQQAQQAQFIVVSLRRPTIEASDRTIGVTQARGAHTQVLGIAL